MPHSSSLTTSVLVAIIIAGLFFVLLLGLLYAFCRCRRTHAAKKLAAAAATTTPNAASQGAKEFDVDASHGSLVVSATGDPQQSQSGLPPPPPPYYPTGSLDSKQLDGGMELTLTALHDPDEQLNMQQGEMHTQQQQQQQQYQTQPKCQAQALYQQQPHPNGYGYHVTSAIGIDGDSYQVLPTAAGQHGECK